MCEWVEVCPNTGANISEAPCKVLVHDFGLQASNILSPNEEAVAKELDRDTAMIATITEALKRANEKSIYKDTI